MDVNRLQLPNDLIQKLILKLLLTNNQRPITNLIINHFQPKFFRNNDYKDIYDVLFNYWKKYDKTLDVTILKSILSNDSYQSKIGKDFTSKITLLNNIIDQVERIDLTIYQKQFLQNTIIDFIKSKAVYYAILDQIDHIEKTNDVSTLIPKLQQTLKINIQEGIGVEYFQNIKQHIEDLKCKTSRTPFKWKMWDSYTYGGIPKNQGCLFMIMAQPGLGKSQMMMNIGYNWLLQNKNVLMVSLQMSQKMYSNRMSALFSDICVNELADNTQILLNRVELVKKTHNSRLFIKQFSPNQFNCNMLKNLLQKLQKLKNFVPDLIIVDYLNIMSTNGPSYRMKSYQRVGTISKELRAVSVTTCIPILSATQINRCVLNTSLVTVYKNDTIKEIMIKDIQIGDKIKTINGYNEVINKWQEEQETYQIILKSGKKIICSKNHIFPTNKGQLSIQTGLNKGIKLQSRNLLTIFYEKIINIFNKIRIR